MPLSIARFRHLLGRWFKPLVLTVMGVLLFVAGIIGVIYSPWAQDAIRLRVVAMMNRQPDTKFALADFRLRWPLRLEVKELEWIHTPADTMIAVGWLFCEVSPRRLVEGIVDVPHARLEDAYYRMGSVDSATCVTIRAGAAELKPAHVRLNPMHINVADGNIARAMVSVFVNPNPPPSTAPKSEPSPLNIDVKKLNIDDLTYTMSLLPTIDSLGVTIGQGRLEGASIDLLKQTVRVEALRGHRLAAAYIAADSATIANTVVAPPNTTAVSLPWRVDVALLDFNESRGLYTTQGYKPITPGMDFAYISADQMRLVVKDFVNEGTKVHVPISVEGFVNGPDFELDATGTLNIDSAGMAFEKFEILTPQGTNLKADGYLGTGDMMADPSVPVELRVDGRLAAANALAMFPTFESFLKPMAATTKVNANIDVAGTMGDLRIRRLDMAVNDVATVKIHGRLRDVISPQRLSGDLALAGTLGNVQPWVTLFAPDAGISVPPMKLQGQAKFGDGAYAGNIEAVTATGKIALDGKFHAKLEAYEADLTADHFAVNAFMPSLGVGAVTTHIQAHGQGFDPTKPSTQADVALQVPEATYRNKTYRDISGTASLHDGHATVDIESGNTGLQFALKGTADFTPRMYDVDVELDATDIDLAELGALADGETGNLTTTMRLSGQFNPKLTHIGAKLRVDDFMFEHDHKRLTFDDVTVHFNTDTAVTNASLRNGDFYAYFSSPACLDSLMAGFTRTSQVLDGQFKDRKININDLQRAIPKFDLDLDAGTDNMLTQILDDAGMKVDHVALTASNDSVLTVRGSVFDFVKDKTRLDTLRLAMNTLGNRLDYNVSVNNRPGTLDDWAHVNAAGYFVPGQLGLHVKQSNIKGKTGYDFGANVTFGADSTATLHLTPYDPTIAYYPWTINPDNFITYSFAHRHLDADLHMEGGGSTLALYTEHAREHAGAMHGSDEDLVVNIGNIRLQDLMALNPFFPPVKGILSADMRVNWQDHVLTGNGNVNVADLYYDRQRVGNLRADIDMATRPGGLLSADMALWVDGTKAVTLRGALNDSTRTTPFNLDLTMIHMPLRVANPFLPGIAKLSGDLNGSMDVSGDASNPLLNGYLDFDTASVHVDMLGAAYTFSEEKIPVTNSIVHFNKYAIRGSNENPLTIDGTVDIRQLANTSFDLRLTANNMCLVNTKRAQRGADVYGRAFASTDLKVKGNMHYMSVAGNVSVLPGTNVTYVMPQAAAAFQARTHEGMVRFVNFADTAAVAVADSLTPPPGMLMDIDATLQIMAGSTINVDLNSNGTDRAQIKAQGAVNYVQTPFNPDARVTGRLNIDNGFVRYSPPMMSEKKFVFDQGSYVSFNGDMLNPYLNIQATDQVRANVTQSGQNSRLINFDILLSATGPLEQLDVKFDLATDDDATVANELASMSPAGRASAAMNMLVTNMYSGSGTKADGNLGGNALYSFLTSQLNNWAASAIRGVDISFGIDQYDSTRAGATQQTTSYSYQVSKSLFNDRFKIVVGGNYSTDDSSDESIANNLVNNISLEYMLNQAGTMYVRLFRHTGYESILEGEITQTGVGFVYRRKINRLSQMLGFGRRHREQDPKKEKPETPKNPDNDSK